MREEKEKVERMTTAQPVPPLTDHAGGANSYHVRRKRQKALSARVISFGGKENGEGRFESNATSTSPKRRSHSSKGNRNIKSAGSARRQTLKTHKAEIHFPIPPQTSYGSPRKGRLTGNRNARKSRSATTSLFHLDTKSNEDAGIRQPAWTEDPGLSNTIYGQPAYGTPTLALRERVGLLEKEKVDLLMKLHEYEQELAARKEEIEARDEEVKVLRERVSNLEEDVRVAEEACKSKAEQEEAEKASGSDVCENCLILKEEVEAGRRNFDMMTQEYQKLEFAYEDSESQRSELERRCYFLLLDTDSDGLIQLPELATHEILLPYAPEVLEICFTHWNYQSGIRNLMSWDDFALFFQYVEDKNNKASQTYWFNVLDVDGDGYVGDDDDSYNCNHGSWLCLQELQFTSP